MSVEENVETPQEEPTVFQEAGVGSGEAQPESPETQDFEVAPEQPAEGVEEPAAERPEWLPEKFQTPQEMVDAYNQMGKKIRDIQQGKAPEQYELNLPEGVEALPDDDAALFKELGLSNDQAQNIMDHFFEQVVPEIQQIRADAELEKLSASWGTEKDSKVFTDRLGKLYSWAQESMPPEVVREMGKSASGIQTLQKMMDQGYTPANVGADSGVASKAELESMVQDERYWKDPAFREKVDRQFRTAFGG